MAQILIRGRISTVELAAGEEAIVEDTERVQELARFGYTRIVGSIAGTHHPDPVPTPVLSAAERAVAAGEDPVVAEIESAPADDEPPRSGAGSGKATWQRFLISRGVDYPDGATRDELIAIWDSREG